MTKKAKFVCASIFVLIVAILFLVFSNESVKLLIQNTPVVNSFYKTNALDLKTVYIDGVEITVEIAKTTEQKEEGLSERKGLDENQGMLFVFEKNSYPTFWMKDMNFAIDIIWIADGEIVGIEKNIQPPEKGTPKSELTLYHPPEPIDYVLEVNAGFSDEKSLQADDNVDISRP